MAGNLGVKQSQIQNMQLSRGSIKVDFDVSFVFGMFAGLYFEFGYFSELKWILRSNHCAIFQDCNYGNLGNEYLS